MTTATVRVMSPEEIAARGAGDAPFLVLPERATVFAERAMRLRQLARGHAMGDFLAFTGALAEAQQQALAAFPASVPLPDGDALDRAAMRGLPPLAATDWPRDPAWHDTVRTLARAMAAQVPAPAAAVMQRLAAADGDWLETQADALLHGVMQGLDLAAAPLVAAALQVYWTHLAGAVHERGRRDPKRGSPFGRVDDAGSCPCCGSRPTASITRAEGDAVGQRYLQCSLCSAQWHMVRIRCSHCGNSSKSVAYQSLDLAGAGDAADPQRVEDAEAAEGASRRAAQAAVQAETCDECGHYLKIVHTDRDPFVDPVADDLASITLDLLVADAGFQRHGVNLMLLFGDPEPGEPPPDPEQR